MAGNKNPWRDIFSPAEWTLIQNSAAPAARVVPQAGGHRAGGGGAVAVAVGGGGGGWTRGTAGGTLQTPQTALQAIGDQITLYDGIAKDNYTLFDQRSQKLQYISGLCDRYLQLLGRNHTLGAKGVGGKQLNDQVDVWVGSLGRRALKKSEYLQNMKAWHVTAKAKYKDRAAFSLFLRQLAADNTRDGGAKLHVTPYATIEKVDPYHRQAFVFPDPVDPSGDTSQNEMGAAFIDYMLDLPASNPDRATNPDPSFYEWLEYHPFCVGTPVVTPGAQNFKNPARISYDNLDLAYVYMPLGQMTYERILSGPGVRHVFNTSDFGASSKGPANSVAFVWDADCGLWAHEHGWDGFIHASAKKGKKIRCSGMLVAANGKATCITNQSGHYAPTAQSIFNFVRWLRQRNCLAPNATVEMHHDAQINGTHPVNTFLSWGVPKFPPVGGLQYWA